MTEFIKSLIFQQPRNYSGVVFMVCLLLMSSLVSNSQNKVQVQKKQVTSTASATFQQSTGGMWVTGYYPVWASGTMTPEQMNYDGLTHIIHFSANPSYTSPYLDVLVASSDSLLMEDNGSQKGIVSRLITTAHSHGTKVFLSLGGVYGTGATTMDYVNSDSARAEIFAVAAVAYAKRRGYDGVEVDWEQPSSATASARLYRLLRRELNTWSTRGELAVAVSPADRYHPFSLIYNKDEVLNDVDQLNLMMYDMDGTSSWFGGPNVNGFNAPLNQPLNHTSWGQYTYCYNQSWSGPIFWHNDQSMPYSKMATGIPFYGKRMQGTTTPDQTHSYPQYVTYEEALAAINAGLSKQWDDVAKVPWAGGSVTSSSSWQFQTGKQYYMTYEDTASIREKIAWAKSIGLGGIMIYNLVDGWVASASVKDPLLRTVVNTLRGDTVVVPPPPPPPIEPNHSKIHGQIFFDKNSNGVHENGEPGMSGWTVTLTDSLSYSLLTDSGGFYVFNNIDTGRYTISVVSREFWTQTVPSSPNGASIVISVDSSSIVADFGFSASNVSSQAIASGWNLLSLPMKVNDARPVAVYPSAISDEFSYNGRYVSEDLLETGIGYWIKFATSGSLWIAGVPFYSDTISVDSSWNIIGSVSVPVTVNQLQSIPSGIIPSVVWGYQKSNYMADTIKPGYGYWVNVKKSGKVILSNSLSKVTTADTRSAVFDNYNSLSFTSATGEVRSLYFTESKLDETTRYLYQMPPLPPDGVFDARFESNTTGNSGYGTFVIGSENITAPSGETHIVIRGASGSIVVRWNIIKTGIRYELQCGDGRDVTMEGQNEVVLTVDDAVTPVDLILKSVSQESTTTPQIFALTQNFPNPFNSSTIIQFTIPSEGDVKLVVYDVLGREIATLLHASLLTGTHTERFTSTDLTSGVYFYRLTFESKTGQTTSQIQKMVLMK